MYAYALFVDRNRPAMDNFYLAPGVIRAKEIIEVKGAPERLHIEDETPISFLEWMKEKYYNFPPKFYKVHGRYNPSNKKSLELFLLTWRGEFRKQKRY